MKEGAQHAQRAPKGTIAFLPKGAKRFCWQNGQQFARRTGGIAVGFPSGSGEATFFIWQSFCDFQSWEAAAFFINRQNLIIPSL